MTSMPITVEQFQRHILEKYGDHDKKRGSAPTFMWFIEEVGELATALGSDDPANLREEFADVFAWLCTLANISGVDLAAAVEEKYLRGRGPIGHK
ncbi:MAG: MazG nucleotide pyrophosphohydrolase domain-containing protein [Phycisphaerae bacterium]